jgi:allantoinase
MKKVSRPGVMAELADEPTTLMFHAEMEPPITASVGDDVQTSEGDWEQDEPKKEYFRWHRSRMKKVSRPGK